MYITDLRDEDIELSVKVVIVGNGAVGKSSMIQRYCRGTFTKSYKKTIGVDFLEKQLRVHGEEVRLMLWDTAGQEEFDALTKAYYRGAQACVVAFSTTDRASLLAVRKWRKKVEDECGDIPMVLVQNKIDLISQSEINQLEAEKLATECRMKLYRTSVKEDLNVGVVFQHLAENYVNQARSSRAAEMMNPSSLNIGSSGGGTFGSSGGTLNIGGVSTTRLPPYQTYYERTRPTYSYRPERIRRSSNYITNMRDPCTDYLNNPMFNSLHQRGGIRYNGYSSYWPDREKTISLRPLSLKKNSGLAIRSACKVL